MEPTSYEQLQGKRNARTWKRQFKVAALGKGVWDVFTGVFFAAECPDPEDYGLHGSGPNVSTDDSDHDKAEMTQARKPKRTRATLGPEDVLNIIETATTQQARGVDFSGRMTLYKFNLDEYDKSRRVMASALALLMTWVHPSLRSQLESFTDPKQAYDHLVARYSVTDARAREMAEDKFNSFVINHFGSAQDYVNAVENAAADIMEAGGHCDDAMIISKVLRGLSNHPIYRDFATQYHLLRDIDARFEEKDHVITQLLTFESSRAGDSGLRRNGSPYGRAHRNGRGNGYSDRNGYTDRGNYLDRNGYSERNRYYDRPHSPQKLRDKCTACGVWGHTEQNCWKAHPEQRPQGNNRRTNNQYDRSRDSKPNGMVAAAILDTDNFLQILHNVDGAQQNPTVSDQGKHVSLSRQAHANDDPQTIKLKDVDSKGETRKGGVGLNNSDCHYCNTDCVHCTATVSTKNLCAKAPTAVGHNVRFSLHDDENSQSLNTHEAPIAHRSGACFTTSASRLQHDAWILDSGANVYICNDATLFTTLHMFHTSVSTAGQGSDMHIAGGGTVELTLEDGDGDPFKLTLHEVAYAPLSRCNLISVSKLAKAGILGAWTAGGDVMNLTTPAGHTIGTAIQHNGLYHLKLHQPDAPLRSTTLPFVANVDFTDAVWKEHRRLGHLSLSRMLQLCDQATGLNVTKEQVKAKLGQICPVCATTKAIVRIPREPARVRYQQKGELVHVDVWGPYSIEGWDHTRWMGFSTDDWSRSTEVIRIQNLVEFPDLLRRHHKRQELRFNITIRRYRVDNAYNKGPWKAWCDKKGITIESIAPYAHHQLGIGERVNRTIREGTSAMIRDNSVGGQIRKILQEHSNEFLRTSTLPDSLWPEAMEYAAWLKNRTPTRANRDKKTPWELEHGTPPDLSRERTWGSRVYVSYTDEERRLKLHDARGWMGYFVGCENESTYRVWDPEALRVKRVVYAIVDEAQGLHDPHDLQNHRPTELPRSPDGDEGHISSLNDDDTPSEPGPDDYPPDADHMNDEERHGSSGTTSRFFPAPAAMVTTRASKSSRSAQRQSSSPDRTDYHGAYEDTYVPTHGSYDSAYPAEYVSDNEDKSLINETSKYFDTEPSPPTDPNGNVDPPWAYFPDDDHRHDEHVSDFDEHGSADEEFGEFQSSILVPDTPPQGPVRLPLPGMSNVDAVPIPVRSDEVTTANQIHASDSELDIPVPRPTRNTTRRCANPECDTPASSVTGRKLGPDGEHLCANCHGRFTRNPNNWRVSRRSKATRHARTCGNDQCTTPDQPVYPSAKGPNGEPLCFRCNVRYQKHCKSKIPREPDSWKVIGGQRSRKGMTLSKGKERANVFPESDTSDDNEFLHPKRDYSKRGIKISARVPDLERCQSCYDYSLNCTKQEGNVRCNQCTQKGRICRPLQLNPDGSLPLRRHVTTTPQSLSELPYKDRCYACKKQHRFCDGTLPHDPSRPCTPCKQSNRYCVSSNEHDRIKDSTPSCLRCQNYTARCNKGQPCRTCVENGHSRCTYESEDGTRWYTSLTSPIQISERKNTQDPNVDYYNPELGARRGCAHCQDNFDRNAQRATCDFEQGGPPCWKCVKSTDPNANRCTNWVAPGRIESVATRMFKIDENGNVVRDPTKIDNSTATKKRRTKDIPQNELDTSESDTEDDIYSEEVKRRTRQKLSKVTLPEAFLAAMSLATLQDPINKASLPDPQSYSEAMRSVDAKDWREAIASEYQSLTDNKTWEVTVLPTGRKALTTKWVLKKKLGPKGEVLKYKARMVARGFQQVEGFDFAETYSGVVKAAAYRLIFALVVLKGWTCHQMDVVTAFLTEMWRKKSTSIHLKDIQTQGMYSDCERHSTVSNSRHVYGTESCVPG